MKMRWKAAAVVLPLAAVLAGCTQGATEPAARPAAPSLDELAPWDGMPYDTVYDDGGYYGSGHREEPVPEPTDSATVQ